MRRLIAGIAGLTLAAAALTASAQTAPAAAPAAIAAAPGALSVENTSIGDLLADAAAKSVLEKDMPMLIESLNTP